MFQSLFNFIVQRECISLSFIHKLFFCFISILIRKTCRPECFYYCISRNDFVLEIGTLYLTYTNCDTW